MPRMARAARASRQRVTYTLCAMPPLRAPRTPNPDPIVRHQRGVVGARRAKRQRLITAFAAQQR